MAKDKTVIYGETKPTLSKQEEKTVQAFHEEMATVKAEVERVHKRKQEAKTNIEEIKDKLGLSSIDVITVEDDNKRFDFLGKRKKLKEQLEEEELYLHINLEAYRKRLVAEHNLEELYRAAIKVRAEINKRTKEHLDLIKKYQLEAEEEQRNQLGVRNIVHGAEVNYKNYKDKINSYDRRMEAKGQAQA